MSTTEAVAFLSIVVLAVVFLTY